MATNDTSDEDDWDGVELPISRPEAASGSSRAKATTSLIGAKRQGKTRSHRMEGAGDRQEKNGSARPRQSRSDGPRSRKKQFAVSTQWERDHEETQALGKEALCGSCCPRGCTCSIEDFYSCCCCLAPRRVGNMFILLEKRGGSPLLVVGPCWPFCAFVTVPLILLVSALVSYFIVLDRGGHFGIPWWLSLLYFPLLGLTLATLCCVSCRDPGLLERVTDEEAGRSGWFWNEQTGSFRPTGAMYCRECKVLIQDYDHLCPWTGTGIGRGNMCAFKLFVGSVNVLCYFSIALVAFSLIKGVT